MFSLFIYFLFTIMYNIFKIKPKEVYRIAGEYLQYTDQ